MKTKAPQDPVSDPEGKEGAGPWKDCAPPTPHARLTRTWLVSLSRAAASPPEHNIDHHVAQQRRQAASESLDSRKPVPGMSS